MAEVGGEEQQLASGRTERYPDSVSGFQPQTTPSSFWPVFGVRVSVRPSQSLPLRFHSSGSNGASINSCSSKSSTSPRKFSTKWTERYSGAARPRASTNSDSSFGSQPNTVKKDSPSWRPFLSLNDFTTHFPIQRLPELRHFTSAVGLGFGAIDKCYGYNWCRTRGPVDYWTKSGRKYAQCGSPYLAALLRGPNGSLLESQTKRYPIITSHGAFEQMHDWSV